MSFTCDCTQRQVDRDGKGSGDCPVAETVMEEHVGQSGGDRGVPEITWDKGFTAQCSLSVNVLVSKSQFTIALRKCI